MGWQGIFQFRKTIVGQWSFFVGSIYWRGGAKGLSKVNFVERMWYFEIYPHIAQVLISICYFAEICANGFTHSFTTKGSKNNATSGSPSQMQKSPRDGANQRSQPLRRLQIFQTIFTRSIIPAQWIFLGVAFSQKYLKTSKNLNPVKFIIFSCSSNKIQLPG